MKIMKKRLLILFFAIATAVCLGVGLAACGDSSSDNDDVVADVPSQSTESEAGTPSSTTKQAPVYQGMVISSANSASAISSEGAAKTYAALGGAAADPTPSAEATGALSGDVNIEGVDIDTQILVDDDDTSIEDEITAQFGVTGTGQSIYYADPGEKILITVKFSNPDSYEILSFRINGQTYASYMFEYGSDMENIIVKLDVGTKIGFADFTIDEIKYIDGTEIKDVLLNGETTVKCGVRTDNLPYATVTNETVTLDEISMDVKVTDLYDLIYESDGYCVAVLFDDSDNVLYTEYLEVGANSVTFSSLKANTVYQYAVFAVYDDLSGAGVTLSYLYKENFRTKNIVLFDNVEVTKTGVSFSYLWYEGYENATINKLSLESEGDTKLTLLESDATEVTGLLSNHNYTLTASYIGLDESIESIHISFTTYAMETPEVEIGSLTATKTEISYTLSVTDEDKIGYVSSVKVMKGEDIVSSGLLLSGTVSNLLSDNEYTLVVIYAYNLNDGYGERTIEVSKTVTTEAMATPIVKIESLTSTKTGIAFGASFVDVDGVGKITSVTLTRGSDVVYSGTSLTSSVSGLLSDNEYTLAVVCTYDLNDGLGERMMTVSETVRTIAMETPEMEIYSLKSTKVDISYELSVADADGVGELSSVTLYKGIRTVGTAYGETGGFDGLLSDNEYTITAVYTYDLNDGFGARTMTVSGTVITIAMETPEIEISSLKSTKVGISYELSVADADGVGELSSVTIYKGIKSVGSLYSETGEFDGLLSDNEYTITAVYTYDLNDGYGPRTLELTETVSTKAMETPGVVIYGLTSTKDEVGYELVVTDADCVANIVSVSLYSGAKVIGTAEGEKGTFTGLYSGTEYTLKVVYTYDLNDGDDAHTVEISGTVSTRTVAAPSVAIEYITPAQTGADYELSVTDDEGVLTGIAVSVVLNGEASGETEETSGSFTGLLSDNEYTLTVVYTYDLCDGNGVRTEEVTGTFRTLAKAAPVAEIGLIGTDIYSLTFSIAFADTDGVGKVTNVILYDGDEIVEETGEAFFGEKTYENLGSYTLYTLSVAYEYNLNDGVGTRYATADLSAYTDPFIEFSSMDIRNTSAVSVGETVVIVVEMDNPNGISFSSATINGAKYSVSTISSAESLYIEIVNDGQFMGGDTELTITQVVGTLGGTTYTINITENNTSTVFINGELLYNDFTVVRFDEQGRESEALYRFRNEELYYKISLGNSTGYDIYDVTIGSTTYSGENIHVSEDKQTVYVALPTDSSNGWRTDNFYGVSYGNETLENKHKATDISTAYYRLKSNVGEVVQISTADQLLDMDDYYYYVLVNDIDLTGKEWANMNNSMYGVFDGNGYTISGISAVTTYTDLDLYLGLFYNVQGIVMNLDICDILYYVFLENATGNSYSVYAGGLSARSDRVTIVNCQISSSIQVTNYGKGYVYVGAISGYGSSNTKLYNVVTDLSAEIDYVTGYYFNGYFGNSLSIDIFDSSCRSVLTKKSDGSTYFADDEFTFSLVDGVYSLTGYLGTDTNVVLPETYNGHPYGIGERAFYSNSNLVSVTLPDGLLFIDEYAFAYCYSLTSITIPESVEWMGGRAFYSCTALTEIFYNAVCMDDVPSSPASSHYIFGYAGLDSDGIVFTIGSNVEKIPAYLFYVDNSSYEINLKSIVFEDDSKCTSIGDHAFYRCSYLENIYSMPESIEIIGGYAFAYCYSLKIATIPENVEAIGYEAFAYCYALTEIYYDAVAMNDLSSGYYFEYAGKESDGITIYVSSAVKSIPSYLFYAGGVNIISVIFEENSQCTSIGSYAFYYCSNLENVTLGESLTTIRNYAFYHCTSLRSIIIPASVTSIGTNAFCDCYNLVEIWNLSNLPIAAAVNTYGYVSFYAAVVYTEKDEESRIVETEDGYRFYQDGDTWYLVQYVGNDTDLVLPSDINGEGYAICRYAFYNDDSITSVTMPDSVTAVGDYAFNYCVSIKYIKMSEGLTTIGTYAFADCSSMTSIEIPQNVTTIGTYAFAWCYALTAIYYNAVEVTSTNSSIFYYAGSDADGITVVIGKDVKSIPSYLFYGGSVSSAPKIVSVVFEEGSKCTSIGTYAFEYCSSLVSIVLPSGIKSIGNYAFRDCLALTYVYYEGTPEDWNNISISSSGNTYLTDAVIYYYSETQPTDTNYTYWHYVDGEVVVWD